MPELRWIQPSAKRRRTHPQRHPWSRFVKLRLDHMQIPATLSDVGAEDRATLGSDPSADTGDGAECDKLTSSFTLNVGYAAQLVRIASFATVIPFVDLSQST